jgi:hypothetical protein
MKNLEKKIKKQKLDKNNTNLITLVCEESK